MSGDCTICRQHSDELTHLSLYVIGSEGIVVCLQCRIDLAHVAEAMRNTAGRIHHRMKKEAVLARRSKEV